jgi:hypothetical protein
MLLACNKMYNKTLNKNVFSLRNANEKQRFKLKLKVINRLTKIIVFVIFIITKIMFCNF